jgi:ABC-type thiamine transport system ATPase subunit
MKDRLSRLLGACEVLAREEAAALAQRNFASVARTQEVRSSILSDLAADPGLASCDAHSRARLTALVDSARTNRRLLSRMMTHATEELRKIQSATKQLHTLRAAYGPGCKPARPAFSAHG